MDEPRGIRVWRGEWRPSAHTLAQRDRKAARAYWSAQEAAEHRRRTAEKAERIARHAAQRAAKEAAAAAGRRSERERRRAERWERVRAARAIRESARLDADALARIDRDP